MKRTISIVVLFATLLFLSSCHNTSIRLKEPVNFYYKARRIQYDSKENVIAVEKRESFGHTQDYEYLLEQYFYGPRSEKCISPFPAGITLEELDLAKNKVIIVVSSHLAILSGYELTIACACLAKTAGEMTGMDTVQIISKDSLLGGQESIVLSIDNLVLSDMYIPQD